MYEYKDKWNRIYQCVNKPMADLAELNMNTLANFAKNTPSAEKFSHVKKPEDFLAVQMELLNNASIEAHKYAQKACSIGLQAVTEVQNMWNDIFHDTTEKAAEMAKHVNPGYVKSKK